MNETKEIWKIKRISKQYQRNKNCVKRNKRNEFFWTFQWQKIGR